MQTRKRSFVESITNVVVGFGVSFISMYLILPLFGHNISLSNNLYMGIWFTVISIIRSYCLRRLFTRSD